MVVLTLLASPGLAQTVTNEMVQGTWTKEGLWLTTHAKQDFRAAIQLAVVRNGEEVAWEEVTLFFRDDTSTQLLKPQWPTLPTSWDTRGVPLTVTAEIIPSNAEGQPLAEPQMLDLGYVMVRSGRVVMLLPSLTDAPATKRFTARLAEDEELATISQPALKGGK